jgi:hypothetical protein
MRGPNETISQFAIRTAWYQGAFWSPDNPDGWNITEDELPFLPENHPAVVKAMIVMARMEPLRYARHVLEQHGRAPHFDGVIGPAIAAMVSEPNARCPIPDFAPPPGTSFLYEDPDLQLIVERMQLNAITEQAVGPGSWANCHGQNGIHCMSIRVNPAGMNPRVVPLWRQIMTNVRNMYAGVGLLIKFNDMNNVDMLTGEKFGSTINSDLTFVARSDGWIGLAIVGQRETCGTRIWLKLLASYLGGTTDAQIINQQSTLLAHEIGHNTGMGHTAQGWVMGPSITNGLPVGIWHPNDPATPRMKREFGGVPVKIPGTTPPPPPPPPASTLEDQVRSLQVKADINDIVIANYGKRIAALEARTK